MKVADKLFVAIDYQLSLDSGEEVDKSAEGKPLEFVVGAGRIIPGLENALMGKEAGESFKVSLEPENAYGIIDETLFQEIPRERFPAEVDIQPGMTFQAMGPRGPMMLTVQGIEGDAVKVDLNHPMAGKRLHFNSLAMLIANACASGNMSSTRSRSGGTVITSNARRSSRSLRKRPSAARAWRSAFVEPTILTSTRKVSLPPTR